MFKEEKVTQPEPDADPWDNEHFHAEHNHNQEYTRTRYIYIKSKFPTFTMTFLTIIICIVLGIDIYNTVSENDRTVINTIMENFTELSEFFTADTGYYDNENFIVDSNSEDSYSIKMDPYGNVTGGNKVPDKFLSSEEKLKIHEEDGLNPGKVLLSIMIFGVILLIIKCLCKKEKKQH